jgi:hypothetical protein
MLEMNDTLEELEIDQESLEDYNFLVGDNNDYQVDDDGAVAIANALANNRSITTLRLTECIIEEEGAVALADLLKHTNAIKMLDLQGNRFSYKGHQALVDALSVNLSVTHLRGIHVPSLHQKINRFRQKYLEQDHSTISVAMYPRIFAGVSVKPSALFLLLQENREMFIPYLPDPSGLSSSTRKRKVED